MKSFSVFKELKNGFIRTYIQQQVYLRHKKYTEIIKEHQIKFY